MTTPREQERFYSEFVRYECAAGGPDPHLTLAGYLAEEQPWHERAWRLGCYLAGYNVATGIALWTAWPFTRACEEPELLEPWVVEHWEGLAFRRERRAVRSRTKFAMHLASYAKWVSTLADRPWFGGYDYDAAWRDADEIYGTGRYIKLKLLEGLRRFCGAGVEISDLRARGGMSPREALTLLYPQHAPALRGRDTPENLATADMCGAWARETLAERYGLTASWYVLQSTLCEYKQAWIGRSQYPGRAQDSELGHAAKIAPHWGLGPMTIMTDARAEIFPHEVLGEIQGWEGRRDELGPLPAEYGLMWSDTLYDYLATKAAGDFANPVAR